MFTNFENFFQRAPEVDSAYEQFIFYYFEGWNFLSGTLLNSELNKVYLETLISIKVLISDT